jgi:hypothetical protein
MASRPQQTHCRPDRNRAFLAAKFPAEVEPNCENGLRQRAERIEPRVLSEVEVRHPRFVEWVAERGYAHAAVAATAAFAFQAVTASLGVCCAVKARGIASETKTIAFVIDVNFLDFMAAPLATGWEPYWPNQSNPNRFR